MTIFSICLIYILTVIFSIAIKIAITLNLIKSLAINHITIKKERIDTNESYKGQSALRSDEEFSSYLSFVPLFNIIYSLSMYFQYIEDRMNLFILMDQMGALRKFTSEEVKSFEEENKSIFAALRILLNES